MRPIGRSFSFGWRTESPHHISKKFFHLRYTQMNFFGFGGQSTDIKLPLPVRLNSFGSPSWFGWLVVAGLAASGHRRGPRARRVPFACVRALWSATFVSGGAAARGSRRLRRLGRRARLFGFQPFRGGSPDTFDYPGGGVCGGGLPHSHARPPPLAVGVSF